MSTVPRELTRSESRKTPPVDVLVIDNDESHALAVAEALERAGFSCHVATSGKEGARLIDNGNYDVIITDLVMSDMDGLEILAHAKQTLPDSEVILITGHGTIQTAVAAMQQGAFNYLLKPLDMAQLRAVTEKAAENVRLRRANLELNRRLDERFGFEGVIGNSPQMREVIERLKRIAPTNATVLILGETGTGKELVAQAIHQNSPRRNKPFVALNCAALSENILESELFGHVKGAFTDATSDRVGKFEYANGGTLFLDEVGDMPLTTQIKLLRVLETGEITRVGSNDPIKVNVRIISATNQDLEKAIEAGQFRRDLYHRLKVVTIRLPSLRERREDIPVLVDHFIKLLGKRHGKTIRAVSPAVRKKFMAYDWPGNVRQLRNVIESMIVVDIDGVLDVDDLPEELLERYDGSLVGAASGGVTGAVAGSAGHTSLVASPLGTGIALQGSSGQPAGSGIEHLLGKSLDEIERFFIAETLKLTGGNREEAAKILGIGERTLYRKIKKYQL
jgi:two-component system response regulator HydG